MKITTDMYLTSIREAVAKYDIHTADIANKMALEMKAITLDQYRLAASILADAYIAQI